VGVNYHSVYKVVQKNGLLPYLIDFVLSAMKLASHAMDLGHITVLPVFLIVANLTIIVSVKFPVTLACTTVMSVLPVSLVQKIVVAVYLPLNVSYV